MSRLFDDATPDYLQRSAVITAAPFTQVAWVRTDDATDSTQPVFGHGRADGTRNFYKCRLEIADSQWSFIGEQTMPGRNFQANTSTAPSVNTWHHVAVVEASATDHRAFLDGAGKGTDTIDVAPKSIDTSWISRLDDGSPQHFSGNIAGVAIWNVALTDSEIATLAAGHSPLRVRRGSLIHFWPCNGGQSPEPDIIGGASMTLFGTPTKDFEPPIPQSIVAP